MGSIKTIQVSYPTTVKDSPLNPQSLNRYSYVLNNPLKYTDPNGWWTIAIGGFLFGAFGAGGEAGGMIVIDDDGNIGYITYSGEGVGLPSGSGGIQFQVTNADTIYDLKGESTQIGASISCGSPIP